MCNGAEAGAGYFFVALSSDLSGLSEAVQYVNRALEPIGVDEAKGTFKRIDPQLFCAYPYLREGFPVSRFETDLNHSQLETSLPSGLLGEIQQIGIGSSHPSNFLFDFHDHVLMLVQVLIHVKLLKLVFRV